MRASTHSIGCGGQYVAMTEWRERQPPDSNGVIACWQLDEPAQLQHLRVALRDAISAPNAEAGVEDPDLAERLLVVATELAGNALRHGRPPIVVALHADGHVIVDVADGARQDVPVVDRDRPPGEGGLGLQLARNLAEDVGWYPDAAGKHVWAAFSTRTSWLDFASPR
jgi:anti-sigma regulatory factor (Ser/Thr protein kinase)